LLRWCSAMSLSDYYLVIDFEASGIVPQSTEWEIVEFPIVVVDAASTQRLPIEFHRFVRPTVNRRLSQQCIDNCGIQQADVDAASPIDVVVAEAVAWVESHFLNRAFAVVTCGDYDLGTALRVESQRKGILLPHWLCRWINIKVAFTGHFGCTFGMKGMLSRMGLSLDGRHHCGLDDARNIAKIVVELLKLGVPLELTGSCNIEDTVSSVPCSDVPDVVPEPMPRIQRVSRRWGKPSGQVLSSSSHRNACTASSSGQDGNSAVHSAQEKPPPSASCAQAKAGKRQGTDKPTPKVRIDEPWLSWLVSGVKTHEGRLWRGIWAKLAPGHHLVAYSERYSHVDLFVRDVLRFDDFDAAFASLGKRLVPEGAETPAEALQLYRQWNTAEAVRSCGGVVAVEVSVGEACFR